MTRRLTIHTSQINPPIPTRNHDWQATMDNYEPGDPVGLGPSEGDAVADLYHQIEVLEAEDQDRHEYETGGGP